MPGTAVKPSEVIQLTIVPSTHRQRGDGRRDAERGPLQPMRAQMGAPITYQYQMGAPKYQQISTAFSPRWMHQIGG